MHIQKILKAISDSSQFNNQKKGELFETLVKYYFQYDPIQQQSYSDVYTFQEYFKTKDLGIDLILVTPENTLCAVQCKFHQQKLQKKDVDSFYAEARNLNITETILFTNANHISSNLEKYLNKNNRLF